MVVLISGFQQPLVSQHQEDLDCCEFFSIFLCIGEPDSFELCALLVQRIKIDWMELREIEMQDCFAFVCELRGDWTSCGVEENDGLEDTHCEVVDDLEE